MPERIVYHVADGVGYVGIDRPEKKNALTVAMYAGLVDALEQAEAEANARFPRADAHQEGAPGPGAASGSRPQAPDGLACRVPLWPSDRRIDCTGGRSS